MNNNTLCNNCAGTITLSLREHVERLGLCFCSDPCADHFYSPDNFEPEPVGLLYDLGVDSEV